MSHKIITTKADIQTMVEMVMERKPRKDIAEALGWSNMTLANKINSDPDFRRAYLMAKQDIADEFAEEILEISCQPLPQDHKMAMATVQHRRLQVDTLKWLAGKLKPRSWGDKIELGEDTIKALSPLAQLRKLEQARASEPRVIEAEIVPSDEFDDVTESDLF